MGDMVKKYKVATFIMDDNKFIKEYTEDININGRGMCEIWVYGDEGKYIPHFHLISKGGSNNKNRLDCCICINEPRYFIHGYHTSRLTNKEASILYNKIKEKSSVKVFSSHSVWTVIKGAWIMANGNYEFRKRPPKYSNINKYSPLHSYNGGS